MKGSIKVGCHRVAVPGYMLRSVAEEKVVMMAAMGKIVNDGRGGCN